MVMVVESDVSIDSVDSISIFLVLQALYFDIYLHYGKTIDEQSQMCLNLPDSWLLNY